MFASGEMAATDGNHASSTYLVISLFNSILGSAMLSLPYCFMQVGILGGISLLLGACWLNVLSVDALLHAAQRTQQRTYTDVALRVLGVPGLRLVRFSIFLLQIGTLVGYMDIIGEALYFTVAGNGYSLWHFQCAISILVLLPLCVYSRFRPDLVNAMSALSIVLIMAFIVEVMRRGVCELLVASQMPMDTAPAAAFGSNSDDPTMRGSPSVATAAAAVAGSNKAWTIFEFGNMITVMPVISFCYSNQVALFSIYGANAHQGARKMTSIAQSALVLSFFAFALLGSFGYIAYGSDTMNDILANFGKQTQEDRRLRNLLLIEDAAAERVRSLHRSAKGRSILGGPGYDTWVPYDDLGDLYRIVYAISCICTVPIVAVPLCESLCMFFPIAGVHLPGMSGRTGNPFQSKYHQHDAAQGPSLHTTPTCAVWSVHFLISSGR